MLLSAFLFAAMQIVINITGERIPLMEQVFFRNIVSLVICFVIIRRHGPFHVRQKKKYQPFLFMPLRLWASGPGLALLRSFASRTGRCYDP